MTDALDDIEVVPQPCKHLGPRIGRRILPGIPPKPVGVYECKHEAFDDTTLLGCAGCGAFVPGPPPREPPSDVEPPPGPAPVRIAGDQPWVDAGSTPDPPRRERQPVGAVRNKYNRPVELGDAWFGGHVFVLLAGPSVEALDLSLLAQRGVATFGVNNSSCTIRTNFWTFCDSPDKFHHSIWRDPGVIKFVPKPKMRKRTKVKQPDGSFEWSNRARSFPGVLQYRRNAYFNPETWLYEDSINWGNSQKSQLSNRQPHDLNVMFSVLRLCFYLGFRNVYLLGCDWHMTPDKPYSGPQAKHVGGCMSNNVKYAKVGHMLDLLKPRFDEAGYRVFNCNPNSQLTTFPFLAYDDAVGLATDGVPQNPDAAGWYEDHGSKKPKKRRKRRKTK